MLQTLLLAVYLAAPETLNDWKTVAAVAGTLVAGGLMVLAIVAGAAWAVAQKMRATWRGLAEEWACSESFRQSVDRVRLTAEERFAHRVEEMIDEAINTHNSDEGTHRAAIGHQAGNLIQRTATTEIAALQFRVKVLEGRDSGQR